jgi:hypothetical protein
MQEFTPETHLAIISARRGRSSAGRASRSQCEGRGFDPLRLHHMNIQGRPIKSDGLFFSLCSRRHDVRRCPSRFVDIWANSAKWWRLKFRVAGKEKLLSLGVYPDVSLKAARDKRDEARKMLAAKIDPAEHRRALKMAGADRNANSFEVVAREWFAKYSPGWVKGHADKIIRRFERDVFPWIGKRPIAELTTPDVLNVLQRIEKRGAIDTTHRAHQNCAQVFRYAIATSRTAVDPSAALKGAFTTPKERHLAAITDPKAVGGLIRAIDGYDGEPVTKAALKLAPMVFVRPGELRAAEWAEFDLDRAEWNIPAHRMKTREAHLVPLSKQAVAIFESFIG